MSGLWFYHVHRNFLHKQTAQLSLGNRWKTSLLVDGYSFLIQVFLILSLSIYLKNLTIITVKPKGITNFVGLSAQNNQKEAIC